MVKDKKKKKMIRMNTRVQDYQDDYGILVKREDRSCKPPGPPFSKARGVYERVKSRPEKIIGVLDTFHSQAGHAVAMACNILGKDCLNFYPKYKADEGQPLREPQIASKSLGARLKPLPAGRSCILFHAARKETERRGGYMMPNALKLEESVTETAKEAARGLEHVGRVIIPASSGTIAAGVIKGFCDNYDHVPEFIVHLGYSRSHDAVLRYLEEKSGHDVPVEIIDEGFNYKDKAKPGETPPWPCNAYYDLKAFRWWLANRSDYEEEGEGATLFWNIG